MGHPCDFQGGSAHLTISGDELGGLNLLPRLITTLYYSCPLISFLFASCILDPETGRPRRDLVQWIVIKATPRDENRAKDKQAIFIWFCLENRYFCLPGQGSCCPYTLFFFFFWRYLVSLRRLRNHVPKGNRRCKYLRADVNGFTAPPDFSLPSVICADPKSRFR